MVVSHLIEPMIPWHMVPLEAESKESNKKRKGSSKDNILPMDGPINAQSTIKLAAEV
jgi:hypothetical protein